ncbi:MAG: hypothetical protein IJ935_07300 [Afipia sp.]|nr:hypothetical protein [Afipia sp.]
MRSILFRSAMMAAAVAHMAGPATEKAAYPKPGQTKLKRLTQRSPDRSKKQYLLKGVRP